MTELSRANEDAIQKDVRDSLTRAGIGVHYHNMRLEGVRGGQEYLNGLLDGSIPAECKNGIGVAVYGKGSNEPYDLMMLMARATILTGVGAKVITPDRFLRWVDDRWDEQLAECEHVPVLFITRFVQKGECPYNRWQRRRIESLIDARLDAHRPVYTECSDVVTAWWSEELAARLRQFQRTVAL